jgi:hypothetical protein
LFKYINKQFFKDLSNMKLNFRQGVVRSRSYLKNPDFLAINQATGFISINITTPTLLVTAVNANTNFLIEETVDKINAWGPFNWPTTWGPQTANSQYFLYWDINLATGAITYGFTHSAPIIQSNTPTFAVAEDTHWFDTSTNIMKVRQGQFWIPTCRVFAGSYSPGFQSINHMPFGSQVGITSTIDEYEAGYIVLGNDQKAIRLSDGSLMTSGTDVIMKQGGYSSPVNLEALNTNVLALEPIPAFHCVTIDINTGLVKLASSDDINKRPVAIVDIDVEQGAVARLITADVVFNEQWNWDLHLGKDLFCGPTGQLEQHTSDYEGYRVATILTAQSIVMDFANTKNQKNQNHKPKHPNQHPIHLIINTIHKQHLNTSK